MPTFVHIEKVKDLDFEEVEYFSVRDENLKQSEFERFLDRHMAVSEVETEFADLLAWLEHLGNEGAEERYFRHEQRAQALPPNLRYLDITYEKQLRLYCLRLSPRAVFLFCGGIKTTDKAQDCPNVGQHFYNAQQFCKKIEELLRSKDVYLDHETQRLNLKSEGFYL